MKKLVVIALALFTLNGVAQDKRKNHNDREMHSELRKQMTPSDIADLKSKKLALKLDLSDTQQAKVHTLILDQATAHKDLRKKHQAENAEKKGKPSKDDFVKMENFKLDQQLKMKREMKALLTAEQYSKFEQMKPRGHKKNRKHSKNS
jgi:hypothetical protein